MGQKLVDLTPRQLNSISYVDLLTARLKMDEIDVLWMLLGGLLCHMPIPPL